MDYDITTFSIDEYDAMVEVWNLAGLHHKPRGRDIRSSIEVQMADDPGMFRCCRMDGRMVGVVVGSSDGRKGYINRLAVLPEWRRKGIAKALLESIEKHLEGKGLKIITVLIEDQSQESMKFFRSVGYFFHDDIHYLSKRESQDV